MKPIKLRNVIEKEIELYDKVYVDEYDSTATLVCGSDFWLAMDWLRLLLLGTIVFISGINLFFKKKK